MVVPDSDVTALDVEGSVHHRVSSNRAEEWRRDIRAVAREMGWKIRTGYIHDRQIVWAARPDYQPSDTEMEWATATLDFMSPSGDE